MYEMDQPLTIPADILIAERRHAEAIFGADRLAADGRRASEATTEAFVNVVTAACTEAPSIDLGARKFRKFGADNERSLMLAVNARQRDYSYADPIENAAVAAHMLKAEPHKFMKPKGYPVGIYAISESVYVEPYTNRAKVKKDLVGRLVMGRIAIVEAVKDATDKDLEEAIDIIVKNLKSLS
jgi:hypothetical protein